MKLSSSLIAQSVLMAASWMVFSGEVRGQVETNVHVFQNGAVTNDGSTPKAALIQGTNGNFYGTTYSGGSSGEGCVFEITASGTVTILSSFLTAANDGFIVDAGLVQGLDGNFYGTTAQGGSAGSGTVFKMTPAGTVTILHSFGDGSVANDGSYPEASLIQGSDGNFYGTTYAGGSTGTPEGGGLGIVFKITPQGTVTILHSFSDGSVTGDGEHPVSSLTQGSDGNFYGTAQQSSVSQGCVYKITPDGTVTILHPFDTGSVTNDGATPLAGLIQASDGNFYGTTESGGSANFGTVFKITPQGMVTILHSFRDGTILNDGKTPEDALVQGTDGNFYGTASAGGGTAGGGCVFEITPQGQYTVLHSFGDGTVTNDGSAPLSSLIQGPNGIFYGTTSAGGSGTVFAIAPATPLLTSAVATSGSVSVPFTYQVTATQYPTSYAATNLPDGLSIDSTTGLISGTPTTVETNTVTLTVANATHSNSTSLTITIGAAPVPAITSILTAYGAVNTAFTYSTIATNAPTSYLASGLAGSGLSIDPTLGIISGTPTVTGPLSVTLTATNTAGTSTAVALSIQILAAPPTLNQEYTLLRATATTAATQPQPLLQAFDGNFYYVNSTGGSLNGGAIIELTAQGVQSNFYSFSSLTGVYSPTTLLQAADGNFYGTTGANHQIFKVTQLGQLSVLHAFVGLEAVLSPLIQGFDGDFYGTAGSGGSANFGFAFKMTPQGAVTILHNFGDGSVTNDGDDPIGALVQGSDGNFYGVTLSGNDGGTNGTVFQMTPQGTVTILHRFNGTVTNDGYAPEAGLIQGSDGNFYGTTSAGGSGFAGTVFKITPQGTETILHNFNDGSVTPDGKQPLTSLVQGYDGNFYGTTYAGGSAFDGTVFEMTPQGSVTILHDFGDGSVTHDGMMPNGPLIQSSAGNYYGTTSAGGAGYGTIYSFDAMQTPTHVPIFTGSAYEEAAIFAPFSFTPKAAFGVSGSGVEIGSIVKAQPSGNGIMAALVSLLPQSIHKFFSTTNWALAGTLPNYLTFDPTSGTISGTPVQGGIFTVTMTPTNAIGPGAPMTVTFYIDVPPGINSATTVSAAVATPFNYQIAALPPADSYGATGLPGWLSADPNTGIISGTPPAAGSYVFNAIAANVSGQTVQPVVLTVTGGVSGVPAITSAATATDTLGTAFTYQIATNPAATSYTALVLPTGLLFDAPSGTIMGTPSALGVFQIPLTATNASGSYASVLSLTIAQPVPTTITSALTATAAENIPFSYQITATGSVNSYSETGALPNGVTFNSMTGTISGTPTATGAFPVTLTVGNANGTNMATLTLNVEAAATFDQWETANNFTSGPTGLTDTPENDGVPNLLKYLSNINPTATLSASSRAALPAVGSTTTGGIQYLTLTYRQYALETGITVHLQTSPDLQTWTTVAPPDLTQQVGTDPNTGDPIIELGVKATTPAKQFIRLNVTQP